MKIKIHIQLFIILFALLCFVGNEATAQCTTSYDFAWDNGAGSGNTWLASDVSRSYTNVGGSGVNVTLTLTDLDDQNCDLGNPSGFGDYTETTGGFGNNVLTYQMTSSTSSQLVTFTFTFSEAVRLSDFTIFDIDYNGSGTNLQTFQDEMTFSAKDGSTNVPITLNQHPSATGSIISINGQSAKAAYQSGVSGNVGHTDVNGAVVVSTALAITELIVSYSNGPEDEGESDDHAVSFPGFTFCKAPADTDKDGIIDTEDVDDDNDGIPDEIEACGSIGGGGTIPVDVEIQLDNFPGEVSWTLNTSGGSNIASGSGYTTANQLIQQSYNLTGGNYIFTINDTYGDGLTSTGGYYQVEVDGSIIIGPVNTAYSSNTHPFTVGAAAFSCLSGDPSADADNDGTLNYQDADFCTLNSNGVCALLDNDGDGIINSYDLDADNDGIPDIVEAGGTDTNGDGHVDYPTPGVATSMTDVDQDGLADALDDVNNNGSSEVTSGTPLANADSDGDGRKDYIDLDADNDGIPDIVEAGGIDTNGDGRVDTATDADEDGLADIYDENASDGPGSSGTNGTALVETDGSGNMLDGSGNSIDKDGDGRVDHLDLDADNDGIPDVVEAGGIDTNGDGQVDASTDVDEDGLADIYDENASDGPGSNGTNGTALVETDGSGNMLDGLTGNSIDTDGDGNPDHLDIDADDDGITDIVEVGGDSPSNDGRVDTGAIPWDVDGDGLADLYDTDDNRTGGAGDGAASALVITTADANGDGHVGGTETMIIGGAGSLSSLNQDAAGETGGIPILPNHLDIDADNDGIVDNTEAQATNAYIAPTGYDDDGDGLDNAYDPDCTGSCTNSDGSTTDVTGVPMVLENTDLTDTPDWIDLDADNDGTADINEAGAGVDPGATPADLDGDGLIYDDASATGGAAYDPTNTSDNPSTFDDADDPGVDRDWRQGQCALCRVVYGIQDGIDNQTTSYEYDSNTKQLETTSNTYGIIRTNKFCEIDGWRYYYNPAEPTFALFAMRGDAADLDQLNYIEIRVGQNAGDREAGTTNDSYSRLMNRDWFVKMNSQPTNPVDIRFYYPGTDFANNGFQAADGNADTYNLNDQPRLHWFKVPNWDSFDPTGINADASNLTGMSNYLELTPVTAASNSSGASETDGSVVGDSKNFVQFDDLTSFSGGTAGWGAGGSALPVELTRFEAKAEGCKADVTWVAEVEEDLDHYELEQSLDGSNFEMIAIREGQNLGQLGTVYKVQGLDVVGNVYYRLKIVDLDGSFEYSEIIEVSGNCKESGEVKLYPNPASLTNEILTAEFSTDKEETEIIISDLQGKIVRKIPLVTSKGQNTIRLNLSDLIPGTYNFRLSGEASSQLFILTN